MAREDCTVVDQGKPSIYTNCALPILTVFKYDRIDPAEVQSLKDQIKAQKAEIEANSQGNEEEKEKQAERVRAQSLFWIPFEF